MKGKLDTECFVLAVRNDKAKFKRVKELLDLNVHIKNCTRQRYVDDNLSAVYHPTFVARPKVRAIVPLNRLSATTLAEPSLPPPPPAPSAAPPVSSSSSTLVAAPPVLPSSSASAVATGAPSDGTVR